MIDIKNVIEVISEIVILPVAVITFFLLIYIVIFLWKKDPDVIRSRIFLKYHEFKKAFILLAVFALVLVLHVELIFIPHIFYYALNCSSSFIYNLQRVLGLVLILIMVGFVYIIYINIRESKPP